MRVLFLTDNVTLGGTIRILQSWLILSQQEDIHGYVVTPPGSDFLRWLEAHEIPHATNRMSWPDRLRPLPSLWDAWRLARWARKHRIDIIHCNEHNVYPFARLLRRFLDLPLVCHVRYRMTRDFCEWAFGGEARQPDALLWTSQQQADDCAAAIRGVVSPDRQHLVYLGLDLGAFGTKASDRHATRRKWEFSPEEIVIGQACALRPRKRLEDFVQLVTQLAQEEPRVVGVLAGDAKAGDEPYRAKILQQITDAGLGRRFRWLGNLDDIESFYHGLDVFVSTSEYETFGNSVCEAMACSRPVVAYEGGSVREVLGDAGLVAETGDLPALTHAVRECVQRPELREQLGRASRQRVADCFSPSTSLRRLKTLYESLVHDRRVSFRQNGPGRGFSLRHRLTSRV